ncbi:patr class I histocompatibility antigen, B-1 alpha chain [Triplophysa rosa]|nr:patr class I histocompatibility antigen, B-1 alpha chain [Triplophysa rosa]
MCSAEGFFPAALEQQWMRDGEIINSSYSHKDENYSTNPNGSFTQRFYQELPSQMFETIFSCWVNHSFLNKPLMANLSSTVCYDQRDVTLTVIVASVVSAVLFVFVIIVVECKCQRRAQPQSSVEVSVTPEPVFQSVLQSDVVYSSLGDHHPVPCSRSPSVIWSPLNT